MASGRGQIRLPLNKRQYFVVQGGPYLQRPPLTLGVKMAKEIDKPCTVNIPTVDFSVPDKTLLYKGLEQAVKLLQDGQPLYVGCMGGVGRTGLFLAILAKAYGVKNPVKYVRTYYNPHAVETDEQKQFVKHFIIQPQVRILVKQCRKWAWLKFWKRNLTSDRILPTAVRPPLQSIAAMGDELNDHLKTMYPEGRNPKYNDSKRFADDGL